MFFSGFLINRMALLFPLTRFLPVVSGEALTEEAIFLFVSTLDDFFPLIPAYHLPQTFL